MGSFFDQLFNKKPKDLPELIEGHFEDDIKKALKKGDDIMIQTLLISHQIGETTKTLKSIYSDVHRQLGYSKEQYDKLVDSVCSKVVSKYFPNSLNSERDFDFDPADGAE